jgi:hypothetical protein
VQADAVDVDAVLVEGVQPVLDLPPVELVAPVPDEPAQGTGPGAALPVVGDGVRPADVGQPAAQVVEDGLRDVDQKRFHDPDPARGDRHPR